MHNAVSLQESPPSNEMNSHLQYSCFSDLITKILPDRAYHKWSQIIILSQQTQYQRNVRGRYHPVCCSRSHNWKNWCLLNNPSTCNAFINEKYLWKIVNAIDGKYLRVHCNAGVTYTKKIGELPGYPNTVWYNPKGLEKILSLVFLQKQHLLTLQQSIWQ